MKRKLGWAAAISVLGVATVALPIALSSSGPAPPPPKGIVLGGQVRNDTVVDDQPLPLELPGPPALPPEGFTLAEPPPQGGDVTTVTGREEPVEQGRRNVLGHVDRDQLNYLGYDEDDPEDHEAHEDDEEDCAPVPAGSRWPEDMELTEIAEPDGIRRGPAGPGILPNEACEDPIRDEI